MRSAALLALLFLVLGVPFARGQNVPPRVEVVGAATEWIDVAALTAALDAEHVDSSVTVGGSTPQDGARVVLVVYETEGVRRERLVELPDDPTESARVVALIAANLALEVSLPEAPAEPEPEPDPAAALAEASAPFVLTQRDPRNYAQRRPIRFGTGVGFGAVTTRALDPESTQLRTHAVFHPYTFDLALQLDEHLAIGLTNIGFFPGIDQFSIGGTVNVEGSSFVANELQLFGRVGALVQGRTAGGGLPGAVEVAAYVGGGARWWATRFFSVGLELGLHLVFTDSFVVGLTWVDAPQWSTPVLARVNFDWHFEVP